MTLDDIEGSLPWGFQDAYLEGLELDWVEARLTLRFRLLMGEHQDEQQRCRVVVRGLCYCVMDPPEVGRATGNGTPSEGLWVNSGPGAANEESRIRLPLTPPGAFVHWFFVQGSNTFIHVCGKSAELTWLEAAPVRSREGARSMFPSEAAPEPPAAGGGGRAGSQQRAAG